MRLVGVETRDLNQKGLRRFFGGGQAGASSVETRDLNQKGLRHEGACACLIGTIVETRDLNQKGLRHIIENPIKNPRETLHKFCDSGLIV